MQDRKANKKIIRIALYSVILAGAAGAATGTYAWYSYQKDINVDFSGTAISKGNEIEVGLRIPSSMRFDDSHTAYAKLGPEKNVSFEKYYEKDITNKQIDIESKVINEVDNTIYWIRGNYIQEVLMDFATCYGSALKDLAPITAGYYNAGMDWALGSDAADEANKWSGFKLTPMPIVNKHVTEGYATAEDYFYLPLAFRVADEAANSEGSAVEYKSNEDIYLTQFDITDKDFNTGDHYNLAEAIRCKVDFPTVADHADDYIFNPTSNATNCDIEVGGALNLNRDTYLDYERVGEEIKEIAYGQFESIVYSDTAWANDPTLTLAECDTFTGNHKKGAKIIDESSVAHKCATKNNSVIDSTKTTTKFISTDGDGYAFADLSIYIEGWDKNVVDQTIAHTFAVSLSFGIK